MKSHQKIERASRANKRLHLIEATITALHVYGPSRTTVDKIVEIAQMSPGIVTFYFDSKAAMLVAALDHLAVEFEEKVVKPVAELGRDPVAALTLLVNLYIDPDLASSRKISVWYAFWGEATSRQEYLDICGRKDAAFAAMVRDRIAALVDQEGRVELDPDAIALGLIGVLEMLWQEMAFQDDAAIDRKAIKARCMAYLSSIFPGRFAATGRPAREILRPIPTTAPAILDDDRVFAVERDRLFLAQWQFIGAESALAHAGAYITAEIAGERVLALRDRKRLRGFFNVCRHKPHAVAPMHQGVFDRHIECPADGWSYKLDGSLAAPAEPLRATGASPASLGLRPIELDSTAGLIFGRLCGDVGQGGPFPRLPEAFSLAGFEEVPPSIEYDVDADWKTMTDQLLEGYFAFGGAQPERWLAMPSLDIDPANRLIEWQADLNRSGVALSWTEARLLSLAGADEAVWRRCFVFPNLLIERFPVGLAVWRVEPVDPGRCRITVSMFSPVDCERAEAASFYLACRHVTQRVEDEIAVAESTEAGLHSAFAGTPSWTDDQGAVAQFRRWIAEVIG